MQCSQFLLSLMSVLDCAFERLVMLHAQTRVGRCQYIAPYAGIWALRPADQRER